MNISALGLLSGLLLLAVPIFVIYHFRLNVLRRFCLSFFRMAVAVAVMGLVASGAVRLNSIVYDVLMSIALASLSAILIIGRAKLRMSRMIVPVLAGTIAGVAIVVFYCMLLVLGQSNPFVPHLFIPFTGIISGCMIGVNARALQTYYSGLLHHAQLYNYLLGNGATHREAIDYLVRRCLQASIVGVSKAMSRVVFQTAPALLFGMVMCGASVFTAATFQVLVYVAVVSASLVALLISLLLARKYNFDEYSRLRSIAKTSSSPSAHPDTGPESQPQAEAPASRSAE